MLPLPIDRISFPNIENSTKWPLVFPTKDVQQTRGSDSIGQMLSQSPSPPHPNRELHLLDGFFLFIANIRQKSPVAGHQPATLKRPPRIIIRISLVRFSIARCFMVKMLV